MSRVQIPSSQFKLKTDYEGKGDKVKYPVIDVEATGKNISKLRKAKGITVRELSRYLGMENTNSVYRWFRGEALPSLDNMYAISLVFGVSVNEIVVCCD